MFLKQIPLFLLKYFIINLPIHQLVGQAFRLSIVVIFKSTYIIKEGFLLILSNKLIIKDNSLIIIIVSVNFGRVVR